ncbi:unnamed protein product [Closterium sp. NIES-64]|nr:unnamed protein product [Closterium sp. NIES-64]
MCTVSRWDLTKVAVKLTPRTVADQQLLHEDMTRSTAEEQDQLKQAWSTHFVAALQGHCRLIETLVRVFPNQKSHWLLIKVHLLPYLPNMIRTRGLPKEYSTNFGEASHKTIVKRHARNTNRRDVGRDIAVRHERLAAITAMAKEESRGKTYETAMRLVSQDAGLDGVQGQYSFGLRRV